MAEQFINTDELSAHLHARGIRVPADTLKHWRYRRTGPEWFRLGHRVLYDVTTVDAWIERQRRLTRDSTAC
jgi:hypothetical protein